MSAVAALVRFRAFDHLSDDIVRMQEALDIHGPDKSGNWCGENMAMAWCGRDVLLEDQGDQQPLQGADGQTRIVADCRIDNRQELAETIGMDVRWGKPPPDVVFILAAYDRWGIECVNYLIGAFAFAIWDSRKRRLFCARDAMGERSLFWHQSPTCIGVASMPKGLFALTKESRRVNKTAVLDYLLQFPQLDDSTYFEGVKRLLPGQWLLVEGDQIKTHRYWSPADIREVKLERDEDYADACLGLLKAAIESRLRLIGSDNPVIAMSGGLDSTAVASVASEVLEAKNAEALAITIAPPLDYNGVAPPNSFVDESEHAASVIASLPSLRHLIVRPGIGRLLDGCSAERHRYSEVPASGLRRSGLAEDETTVSVEHGAGLLLNGGQGNATYSYHGKQRLPGLLRKGALLAWFREALAAVDQRHQTKRGVILSTFLPLLPRPAFNFWAYVRPNWNWAPEAFSAINLRTWDLQAIRERARTLGLDVPHRPWHNSRAMRVQMLSTADFAANHQGGEAACGLVCRDPFVDRRLVEFTLGIPDDQYLRKGETRFLARRMMAGRLPSNVLQEKNRGYVYAAWHLALSQQRREIGSELKRLAGNDTVAEYLDLPALFPLLDHLPESGWETPHMVKTFHNKLLRGLAIARFIDDAESGRLGP